MTELHFPKLMTVGWSKRILKTCAEALESPGDALRFNLSATTWMAPFGVTILSATLSACLIGRKRCEYRAPDDPGCAEYLMRIGFDKMFLRGGAGALKRSTSVELRRLKSINPMYVEDLIDVASRHLNLSDADASRISLYLFELMQNAQDHAHSGMGFFVCAQWYPSKGTLRISFVDVGRGIPTVLRSLPKYRHVRDDSRLIQEATEPGVTTRTIPGGMGLTFVRDYLRRNDGTLTIIAERGKVAFRPRETLRSKMATHFPGTAVDIVMKTGSRRGA